MELADLFTCNLVFMKLYHVSNTHEIIKYTNVTCKQQNRLYAFLEFTLFIAVWFLWGEVVHAHVYECLHVCGSYRWGGYVYVNEHMQRFKVGLRCLPQVLNSHLFICSFISLFACIWVRAYLWNWSSWTSANIDGMLALGMPPLCFWSTGVTDTLPIQLLCKSCISKLCSPDLLASALSSELSWSLDCKMLL